MKALSVWLSESWEKFPKELKVLLYNTLAAMSSLLVMDLQKAASDSNPYLAAVITGVAIPSLLWGAMKLNDKAALKVKRKR